MKGLILVALLASSAQAITTNPASAVTADSDPTPLTIPYRDSAGNFNFAAGTGGAAFKAGGIIGQENYTQVVDTMTKTAGMGAGLTVFSTITIPANTLARDGDSIILNCAGTFNAAAEIRTIVQKLGDVVVSSRTVTMGVAGAIAAPWEVQLRLTRTSAGNQVRTCVLGNNNGLCTGVAANPSIGSGTNTIDETSAQLYTCSADNITAGSTSFLYSSAEYKPAP